MDLACSRLHLAEAEEYGKCWDAIFGDTSFLDICHQDKIYFTLIGHIPRDDPATAELEDPYLTLVVSNDSDLDFSPTALDHLLASLRQPHDYKEEVFEVEFLSGITLNIHHFLCSGRHDEILTVPDRTIYEYYKSGTVLTANASAITYNERWREDATCCDPIEKLDPCSYSVRMKIGGQERYVELRRLRNTRGAARVP